MNDFLMLIPHSPPYPYVCLSMHRYLYFFFQSTVLYVPVTFMFVRLVSFYNLVHKLNVKFILIKRQLHNTVQLVLVPLCFIIVKFKD
jgi:hypothetical protein